MNILDIRNIYKKYDGNNKYSNENITLNVNKGEIMGVFGPNGAGKTTLVRQICGTLLPDKGQILVNNNDIIKYPEFIKKNIASLNQTMYAQRSLTVEEYILFTGIYRGINKSIAKKHIEIFLEYFSISNLKKHLIMDLSGGEKRIVGFLAAIIGFRPLIVLDEPTNDIDPEKRIKLWSLIHKLKNEIGISFLLITHNIVEAQDVVNKVAIMYGGKILTEGRPSEIISEAKLKKKIKFSIPYYTSDIDKFILENKIEKINDEEYEIKVDGENTIIQINTLKNFFGDDRIRYLTIEEPNLEDVYINIMNNKRSDSIGSI